MNRDALWYAEPTLEKKPIVVIKQKNLIIYSHVLAIVILNLEKQVTFSEDSFEFFILNEMASCFMSKAQASSPMVKRQMRKETPVY